MHRNDNYLAGPFGSHGLGAPPDPPLSGSYNLDSEPDMRRRGRYLPGPPQRKVLASLQRQYDPPSIDGEPQYARRTVQDHVVPVHRMRQLGESEWGLEGR